MNAALNTKEKVANKVAAIDSSSTDEQYPSAKAVHGVIQAISTALAAKANDSNTVHQSEAETITGIKTFSNEPKFGSPKITDVANDGAKFASEAQVYAVNATVSGKQDKIVAGTAANNIVAYSGTAGTLSELTRTTSIRAEAQTSDTYIPTEKAVATAIGGLDFQAELPVGTILMFDGYGWVDNHTMSGWYSCIAANSGKGCPNLVDSFIKGNATASHSAGGNTGNEVTIGENNLPAHTHSVNIDTDSKGAHRHGLRSTASNLDDVHGFNFQSATSLKNAIPVSWGNNISTDFHEQFRETPAANSPLYAMSETGSHEHNVSGSTGNNITTATKLNIEPQSYALIFIRRCE
jgi:hypothetical protein